MHKRKIFGWSMVLFGLAMLIFGDFLPSAAASIFISIAAMLIGGVGLYLAFSWLGQKRDDDSGR